MVEQQHSFLSKIKFAPNFVRFSYKKTHTSIAMSVSKEIAATIIRMVTDVFRTVIQE